MKPLQGVSFDIGTKRAVSYFLSDGNSCKLTLMLAEVVHGDEVSGLPTRVTVAIEAGKAAQLDTAAGKTLEFKCQGGAHVMSVDASNQVAY
jgi:copper(I)-binding protein